jgi:hypothetical protein
MMSVAPTLAQRLGGESAGTALAGFYQTIVGGKMKNVAAKELARLGLLDMSKVEKNKIGDVKGVRPGGVQSSDLAASNPYRWINEVFLPALQRHGITDPNKIQEEIAAVFRDRVGAQLVSIFATQQSVIDKDASLSEHAQGLKAADTFNTKDFTTAMHNVGTQLENAATEMGRPWAEALTPALNEAAKALANFTEKLAREKRDKEEHPDQLSPDEQHAQKVWNKFMNLGHGLGHGQLINSDSPWEGVDDARAAQAEHEKWWKKREELKARIDAEELTRAEEQRRADKGMGERGFVSPSTRGRLADLDASLTEKRKELAALEAEESARVKRLDDIGGARGVLNSLAAQAGGGAIPGFGHALFPLSRDGSYGNIDPSTGRNWANVPLPPSRPSEFGGPQTGVPAQPLDLFKLFGVPGGKLEASVTGEAQLQVNVVAQPGSELLRIVADAKNAAKISLSSVSSTGHPTSSLGPSMPEAAPAGKSGGD